MKNTARLIAINSLASNLDALLNETNIADCTVIPGCVRDLQGPAVFEELARLEDKSLRTLGNDFGWKLGSLDAAIDIAAHAVHEDELHGDPDADFSEARDFVAKIASGELDAIRVRAAELAGEEADRATVARAEQAERNRAFQSAEAEFIRTGADDAFLKAYALKYPVADTVYHQVHEIGGVKIANRTRYRTERADAIRATMLASH